MTTDTVTMVTLNDLPATDWFTMTDDPGEAVQIAQARKEPYIWHYPKNGMYYVADKAEK